LKQVLKALGIPSKEVIGVGDAENDHALLDFCGLSAAVANALPALKQRASVVLAGSRGAGVAELIEGVLGHASDRMIKDDPASAPNPMPAEARSAEARL